jgi:hypothetical protein
MICSVRHGMRALAIGSVWALAACAQNPAEPVRGLAETVRFATPVPAMPDFVQASRPAAQGDYLPVGVDPAPRSTKPKTAADALATQQALEAEAANDKATLSQPARP